MSDARFEIWFPSPEEVSVFIETPTTAQARELTEIGLFAAFAARQVANLRSDFAAQSMCSVLADFPDLADDEEVPDMLGETKLIQPSPSRGRKGFEGTYENRNGLPMIKVKPRGFGVLGQGAGFYAPTATLALLLHLLSRHSPEGRSVLVGTARNVGRLGLAGQIGVTSQAKMAGSAVSAAMEALEESDPMFERSDDPDDDYELLVGKTQHMLSRLVDEITEGSDDRVLLPTWMTWRVCREMTVMHYDMFDPAMLESREGASDSEEPGEYEALLERVVADNNLNEVVERLHADCFGDSAP